MIKKITLLVLSSILAVATFAQTDASKTYKMVVSFHSIGTGVPDSKPLTDYIIKFRKANKIKSISADRIGPLGREGEYKLAFNLKELTKKQQKLFITRVKQVAASMKERGSAEVIENDRFPAGSISPRATISTEKF